MSRKAYKQLYEELLKKYEASQNIIKNLETENKTLQEKIKYLNDLKYKIKKNKSTIKYINGFYIHNGKKYNSVAEIFKN
jgi:predicted nuclease with TOPRIM domain